MHDIRISTPTQTGFDSEVLEELIDKGTPVLAIGQTTAGLDTQYTAMGLAYDKEIRAYLRYGKSLENLKNMTLLSLKKYLNFQEIKIEPPKKGMQMAYYHQHKGQGKLFKTFEKYKEWYKKTGFFKEGAEWIAVLTYSSFQEQGQNGVEDKLVDSLEERGFNAFTAFGYPTGKVVERLLIDAKGKPRVSGALAFLFRFSDFNTTKSLEKLDVPVINLITV